MNPTGNSHFNQARIEWAIRLRYSPMPELDMGILASQLNAFRIGELRVVGKTWEIMMERDAELMTNSDKRKAEASGLPWQIVSDGSLVGDRHAEALQYFYDHLTATHALDQDSIGGTDQLIYQAMSAEDYYYSVHEMLLRIDSPAAKEVTAEFRHTPIWFMEARRGYLGYLQHIFDMYGQPCISGEWLTHVGQGWMRPLSMVYALKAFAMRDWSIFNARYGSGFFDAQTTAEVGTEEWNQALKALQTLSNDGAVLHNDSVQFKFLEQAGRTANPFHPMVQWANENYAKCYRGMDMATSSRGGTSGSGGGSAVAGQAVGASVQSGEAGIFLVRDAQRITGCFNERIDRPVIRYLFGQEPRAWFALMPPESDNSANYLLAVQALVPMGLRIALKDIYQAFRFRVPDADDPCLTPPVGAVPPGGGGDDQDEENKGGTPPAPPKPAPVLPVEKPKTDDGQTLKAQTTDTDPIAPGADPGRWQQFNPNLPDTQVDAASFWSRAGLAPKGADGQTLPMPSLGYSLPNERLQKLCKVGLTNSRAAQGLRKYLASPECWSLALNNAKAKSAKPLPVKAFRAAIAKDLKPLADELEKILALPPGKLIPALKAFAADHPKQLALLKQSKAFPAAAKVLAGVMAQGAAAGLTGKP